MKLIAYSRSEGGGMLGGFSSTEVAYTGDGRCRVKIGSKVTHRDPAMYVRYYADGLLEKLSEVCERYNTTSWTDLPDLNIFIHDGATSNICFTFEGGLKIVIGSGKQYPEHFREMYQEFNGLIEESKNYGVDVEVKEVASGMTMGMTFGPPEEFVKLQDYNGRVAGFANPQKDQADENVKWAQFCVNCGAKFQGTQKFCAECGSVRGKL